MFTKHYTARIFFPTKSHVRKVAEGNLGGAIVTTGSQGNLSYVNCQPYETENQQRNGESGEVSDKTSMKTSKKEI